MTQCERMLQMLREAGDAGVTSRQFVETGSGIFKYTNRISDLRRQGYMIEAIRVKDSLYRYVLVREPLRIVVEVDGQMAVAI